MDSTGEEGKQDVTIQLEKSFSVFYLHKTHLLGKHDRSAGRFIQKVYSTHRQQNIAEESPSFSFHLRKKTAHFCMHSASPLRVPSLTLFCAPKSSSLSPKTFSLKLIAIIGRPAGLWTVDFSGPEICLQCLFLRIRIEEGEGDIVDEEL